jgi:AraC-like DNA-binding protein
LPFGEKPDNDTLETQCFYGSCAGLALEADKYSFKNRPTGELGLSVKEVAAMVGFDDPFYFSRVFKRIMKRSPVSILRRKVDKR